MAEHAVEESRHADGAAYVGADTKGGACSRLVAALAARRPAHYVVGIVRVRCSTVNRVGALPPNNIQLYTKELHI